MKPGLKDLVGKRICGVVFAEGDRDPRLRVFLVFSDGTRFEFYGRDFSCCAGLDDAARLPEYIEDGQGKVRWVYGNTLPRQMARVGPGAEEKSEPLESLLQRDLDAWIAAKEVIGRAKRG